MDCLVQNHLPNAPEILAALADASADGAGPGAPLPPAGDRLPALCAWQRILLQEFGDVIAQPSYGWLSKTEASWVVFGDRRRAIANEIRLIIQDHGIGIGWLVLHLQQLCAGHIPLRMTMDGVAHELAQPTRTLPGQRGERILQIPVRGLRSDAARLADLGIAKPPARWDRRHIVSHEADGGACHFCSCVEIHPAEVVVEVRGADLGLSRDVCLGATFAPFGNPVTVAHLLAWDRAPQPLSMSLAPGGIADLLRFTVALNGSIRAFFESRGVGGYPVLDGIHNGWAGNSIFHQHSQFFAPEHLPPLAQPGGIARRTIARREDALIERFDWPLPVFEIRSAHALRTAFLAHELAAVWRFLGGGRRVPYKPLPPGLTASDVGLIPVHTQNLYVPGALDGRVLWLALRDRERVDYRPRSGGRLNPAAGRQLLPKRNLGVLEVTGTWIVDEPSEFAVMEAWSPAERSEQFRRMLDAVAPDPAAVDTFGNALGDMLSP